MLASPAFARSLAPLFRGMGGRDLKVTLRVPLRNEPGNGHGNGHGAAAAPDSAVAAPDRNAVTACTLTNSKSVHHLTARDPEQLEP